MTEKKLISKKKKRKGYSFLAAFSQSDFLYSLKWKRKPRCIIVRKLEENVLMPYRIPCLVTDAPFKEVRICGTFRKVKKFHFQI